MGWLRRSWDVRTPKEQRRIKWWAPMMAVLFVFLIAQGMYAFVIKLAIALALMIGIAEWFFVRSRSSDPN